MGYQGHLWWGGGHLCGYGVQGGRVMDHFRFARYSVKNCGNARSSDFSRPVRDGRLSSYFDLCKTPAGSRNFRLRMRPPAAR
jgi:hypothetical protein